MTLGRLGEWLASWHLRGKGYLILARNYRCPVGEIDLIALDGDTLVFVEVKTRRSDFLPPEASVHQAKRRKLYQVARYFQTKFKQTHAPSRFDVVAVSVGGWFKVKFEHFIDALHEVPHA